ncbi:MAG: hypothetical protein Q4C43_03180 [Prevotella sp.]|nr:hypothetical protein [Prevotella sp.]
MKLHLQLDYGVTKTLSQNKKVRFGSGFMDILYFFHLFKRAEGIMPKIYRHEEGDKPVWTGKPDKRENSGYN